MPSYEYHCKDCQEDFEIFLSHVIRDEEKRCPHCGSDNLAPLYRDFFGFKKSGSSAGGCGSSSSGYTFG